MLCNQKHFHTFASNLKNKKVMTKKEKIEKAVELLKKEQLNTDTEMAHCNADEILLSLLVDLGYYEVVKEFNKIEKWYA